MDNEVGSTNTPEVIWTLPVEKVKNDELRQLEEKPKGNAENITMNPGNVTYEDVKAYLELKQKERYKNNNTL